MQQGAVAAADELRCFGWIQATSRGTIVGEARCSKQNGPALLEWLRNGTPGDQVHDVLVKYYEDTKIKLHFAYFKVLPEERDTCFR
jgi:hypothetical protein